MAKKKVKKEKENPAIEFAAWAGKHYICDLMYWKAKVPEKEKKVKIYTTEKLYKLWKKQK